MNLTLRTTLTVAVAAACLTGLVNPGRADAAGTFTPSFPVVIAPLVTPPPISAQPLTLRAGALTPLAVATAAPALAAAAAAVPLAAAAAATPYPAAAAR